MPNKQFRKRSLLFFLFSFLAFIAYSQTIVITGKITDDKNNPVPGATVSAKGSAANTTADQNGLFKMSVNARVKTLVISSIGYLEQEVSVDGRTEIDVTMVADSKSMNDVVVIGYGSVRRKDVTGAIANVTSKDFNPGVISNPMQQIQGKVAGLVITQPGGDPNGNMIIRLRGQTSLSGGQAPLVVVDGIPLDDINQISSIPPGDIASFDILKDVSATAIYGSRGANGVIIINTKRGSSGKSKVEYNGYAGVNWLSKKLDLLSADEWRAAVKNIPGIDQSTIDGLDKGANTDWQDAVTKNAFTHSHNLAVSGGTGGFNYRASLNYTNLDGIVINTGKEQLGLRFNAQQKALNDKLVINVSLSSNQNNRKYTDYNIFDYVNTTPPTYPVYNPDGSYFAYYDFDQQNPVSQQMLETNTGKEYLTQLYGRVDYEIINGLKLGVLGSTSHYNLHSEYFQPVLPGVGNINNASQTSLDKDSKKGDIHINYLRDFGKHNLNATAVYEYNDFTNDNFTAKGQNYLISQELDNNLGGGNPALNSIGSYKESFKIISFLARVAYNYNSKYYATVSVRRDGSSKFGANNRWANFPSASVAWRISQENFLKNITWINELKINAGFGVVGNQDAIGPYNTLLTLGGAGRFFDPTTSTYQYPQSYTPNQNANPDLKWEERHGKNIGVSFALFNTRLTGNVNVYNDVTKNLLFTYNVPVPPFFYNSILANVGDLTNKGVEVQLGGDIVQGKKFSWSLNGQITFSRTRITSLSGEYAGYKIASDKVPVGYAEGRGYANNAITFLKVGYAPYVFNVPRFAGYSATVDPTTNSNQLYYAADGSKVADFNSAATYYADPTPKFTYGINSTFNYGNLGLNFFLRGVSGQKLFNDYRSIVDNISRLPGNNVTKEALTNGLIGSQTPSDLWLQNASYLRLDNITLSYNFKEIKGLGSLRVYVTGSNLFVISPYEGLDPEIRNGDSNQSYIDTNVSGDGFYPRSKSVVFGANISFN